jgi:fumarate reductase subunit C
MSEARRTSAYTEYHPRWYRRRVSTWWWLGRWSYLKFILREISSVFVAWFILELLLMIHALSGGQQPYPQQAYWEFQAWLRNPVVVFLNIVSLFFVLFHAITWFNLAPAAMVVRIGGKKVPGALIAGSNYAAWVVVTAVLAWFLLKA